MINSILRKSQAFWQESLKRLPYILAFLLVIIVVQGYQNARAAKENTAATRNLVARQDDILMAIAKSTDDGNVTAQRQTAIIICMLQVPISQRTTDLLENCRKQVEAAPVDQITLPQPIDASQDPSLNRFNSSDPDAGLSTAPPSNTTTNNPQVSPPNSTPANGQINTPLFNAGAQLQVSPRPLCTLLNAGC